MLLGCRGKLLWCHCCILYSTGKIMEDSGMTTACLHCTCTIRPKQAFAKAAQDVFCTTSRTILPKGACCPLLDTPCGWRGCGIEPSRTRATSGRCITSQGFHAPTPRPSSSRLDCDRGDCRVPRNPIRQGGDFALPLHPHRPKGVPAPWNRGRLQRGKGSVPAPPY